MSGKKKEEGMKSKKLFVEVCDNIVARETISKALNALISTVTTIRLGNR